MSLTSKTLWMNVGVTLAVVAIAMRVPATRDFVLG